VCSALCTTVAHNIAQNRPDNFPSYPPDNHPRSNDVYLREGGINQVSFFLQKTEKVTVCQQKNCIDIYFSPQATEDICYAKRPGNVSSNRHFLLSVLSFYLNCLISTVALPVENFWVHLKHFLQAGCSSCHPANSANVQWNGITGVHTSGNTRSLHAEWH